MPKLKRIDKYGEHDIKVLNAADYLDGSLYGCIECPLYGDTGLKIYSDLVKLSRARGYKGEGGVVVALLEVLHSFNFESHISENEVVEEDTEDFIVAR